MPGHNATVLVALASTAGTCVSSSAGKDTKLPPPATEFSIPAITAAQKRKMVLECKRHIYHRTAPVRWNNYQCEPLVSVRRTALGGVLAVNHVVKV